MPAIALGQPSPPNILMIAIDDLNDWIGPLGGYSLVRTPNIGRLVGLGCVYRNAQSNVPACSPSRAATLFGLQPYFTGIYTNREEWQRTSFFANFPSLPRHFRDQGYFTVGTGKVFHDDEDNILARIDPPAWDEYQFCAQGDECRIQVVGDLEAPVSGGRTLELSRYARNRPGISEVDFGPSYQLSQVPDVVRATWMGQSILRATHSKPFFAACGIVKPHFPAIVPQQFFNLYPEASLFYPPGVLDPTHHTKTTNADFRDLGATARRINTFLSVQTGLIQSGEWKAIIRAYLASISLADHCVGILLDALQAGPNAGSTVIVLWSDHGWQLGEKLAWQKFTLWERALRIPLIVAGPGIPVANRTIPASLIDVYPTLTDLALGAVPGHLQGRSLKRNLQSGTNTHGHAISTWREASNLANSGPHFSMRTATHRYIRYQSGEKELYDHRVDRYEFENRLFGGGTASDRQVAATLDGLVPRAPYAPRRGGGGAAAQEAAADG